MRAWLGPAAAAAVALALAACPYHPRAPMPRPREGDWARARDSASRRAFLYDGLAHRATATVTYLSPQVREARARRLAEWLDWTPQELESRLAQERAEADAGEEFLVALFTAGPKDNDLDAPRSIWRVALKVGTEDLLASRVTSIGVDATVAGLFPYIGPFDVVYRVIVPHSPSGPIEERPFVLQLASGLGKLELDFGAPSKKPPDAPWEPVPPS
ncbi:MAG TPA: hypothetical protein VFK90_13960 [Anaeromyxobacter sp.]|nr:hypothetical protein [Anaeromyxobacter sp.]